MMTEAPDMAVINAQEMPAEVPAPAPAQEPTRGSFARIVWKIAMASANLFKKGFNDEF